MIHLTKRFENDTDPENPARNPTNDSYRYETDEQLNGKTFPCYFLTVEVYLKTLLKPMNIWKPLK